MSDEINFNDLAYHFISPNIAPINFIGFKVPLNIYNDIKNGNISIEKGEEDQKKFKSSLSELTSGNPKYGRKYQLDAITNIKNLYTSREKVINLFNDYAKIRSEAMFKTKQGTGFKVGVSPSKKNVFYLLQ